MTRARFQRGFTLVELVAASAITALVTLATAGLIGHIATARQRTDVQLHTQQEARTAAEALAVALRNAYRPGPGDRQRLEGGPGSLSEIPHDRIRFFAVTRRIMRPGEPQSDVSEVAFYLNKPRDAAFPAMFRRTDPTHNDPSDGGGVVEHIASNIIALRIRYFDGRRWRTQWHEEESGWPLLIRVEVTAVSEKDGRTTSTVSRLIHLPAIPADENIQQGNAPR